MDTLLDALQEGRLFELPDTDKADALQFLAHVIEAFPEIPAGTDVVECVKRREELATTALGKGFACPHARVPFDDDLKCVVGWSPAGIDYGSPDGKPVTLVVMYLVPENQRNHYLREISQLAKAISTSPVVERSSEIKDLNGVRHYLLDLIDSSKEATAQDSRARMIRLQAKVTAEPGAYDWSSLTVEPVILVTGPGIKPIALTNNHDLMATLDGATDVAAKLELEGAYQRGAWRLVRRAAVTFQGGRVSYDCLALKMKSAAPPA